MVDFGAIGSILSGAASGGITGLIGLGINAFGDWQKRKADLEMVREQNALTLRLKESDDAHQLQLAQLNAEQQKAMAELSAEQRTQELGSGDFQTSMAFDKTTYTPESAKENKYVAFMLGFVDLCRGLTRPGITWTSMFLLGAMLYWLYGLYRTSQMPLTQADTYALAKEIVSTATYIATTATVWWFGARAQMKK